MADVAGAAVTAAKSAFDAAAKLLGSGSEASPTAGSGSDPSADVLAMARSARERYRTTANWMLAAFAAVGVLLFGSLPFSNASKADLTSAVGLRLLLGLLLAALGIAAAIWATSTVLEPADASLGELSAQLARTTSQPSPAWLNPEAASRWELKEILTGKEHEAHLGPKMASIDTLIGKLGALDALLLDLEGRLRAALAKAIAKAAAVARHSTELDALDGLIAVLEKLPESDQTRAQRIAVAVARRETTNTGLTAALTATRAAEQVLADVQAEAAPTNAAAELYNFHRTLLLAESAVMQSRGTFRLARLVTTAAAVLTLVGAVLYATALPRDGDSGSSGSSAKAKYTPVTISVKANTGAWKQLDKCHSGSADLSGLVALLKSADDADGKQDGPFTATVTDPKCPGDISVDNGDGAYRP